MKFKYIGENNTYCLELLAYNIMSKKDNLKKGQVIEVPDENATLINALNASHNSFPSNILNSFI